MHCRLKSSLSSVNCLLYGNDSLAVNGNCLHYEIKVNFSLIEADGSDESNEHNLELENKMKHFLEMEPADPNPLIVLAKIAAQRSVFLGITFARTQTPSPPPLPLPPCVPPDICEIPRSEMWHQEPLVWFFTEHTSSLSTHINKWKVRMGNKAI